MIVQLIDRQARKFCINGVECSFLPIELFIGNNIIPVKRVVKGSTLGWYINRKFVSYKQIKKAIKKQ
jgi:hypothetical protein